MLCLASSLLVACGGGDDGGDGESGFDAPSDSTAPDDGTTADAPEDTSSSDVTMEGLVGLIPDQPGASDLVIVNEYGPATEAAGVEQPEAGADEGTINDWFVAIGRGREGQPGLGLSTNGFFGSRPTDDAGWRQELGWAPIDVTGAVESLVGDDFPGLYAFTGDFDPEAIDEAVHEDPVWGDQLEIVEHSGVEYYSWGEDNATSMDVTVVREFGRGGRMAVLDDHTILWSWATAPLEGGIDAALGETDSLADNAEIGPLAQTMDAAGALAAILTADGDAYRGTGSDTPTLVPYTALASGTGSGDDGAELHLAFLHDDAGAAEENAGRIETIVDEGTTLDGQPWSEIVALDNVQTTDDILLVTLQITDPEDVGLWNLIVFERDPLLASA